ncbi:Undecaprenyl-phosphate galactose phosphotransferase, WbaP/exopolysaccharide biosynthesis polyprenyl glycosylphosphotransferase [Nonomuraea pusilla]|uniref:Undecaprenyl-phosphate galactose phosphotransferase, WbaP/exopolysaccharide biosynthesis polyprenyl glycosylphosphotransferase n=2 Tax=Nonomuraea pusilla TaxID=46177 RepID=A0A1H7GLY7_9ACTN|nr:Undecaprenyl-phosphate galactose phosphotransferase, WbaP/exopolysaccharide biosynthesis polyprenyl glycosylphosphotransferase [Nonomuraea pusilla]
MTHDGLMTLVRSGHDPSWRVSPRMPVWVRAYRMRAVAADLSCAAVGAGGAFLLRFGGPTPYVLPYLLVSAVLPLVWVCAVALNRAYEPRLVGIGSEEFRRVVQCGVALTAFTAIGSYVTKTDVARGYVVLALPLVTSLTLTARYLLRRALHRSRARGTCMRRVVAVGHATAIAELVQLFRAEPHHGMHVVAACLPDATAARGVGDVPVAGDFNDVPLAVSQFTADTVAVLACPEMDGQALRRLAWRLERTCTELVVAPALMDVAGPRTTIRPAAGLPLLHVEHPELAGARQLVKNVFDRLVAAALLVILAPLLAGLAVAVRATSPGPALFRQTRVGRDGELFTIYKFRTMRRGSEHQKVTLVSDGDGLLFKVRNDPRITPLGARMRRHSLDELPQLLNVVLGHMSLVGPRPPLPEEVARYGDDVRRRLLVRPGLTGLWQVSGRSDLSWEESVRLDLRYVENWSLTLDLQILWKTWSAVARGQGAY